MRSISNAGFGVVAILQHRIHVPVGQHLDQARDARLDEIDAGGFQRLEETAREARARRNCAIHIFRRRPVVNRSTRGSASARAVEVGQQRGGGLVVADVRARIHVAVAGAVLQRDAPLPARGARRRARVRRRRAGLLAGHGHRAIAGQPVRPVLVAGLQRLLDQQAAESRAVDEQVAGDARAALQRDGFDEAVFAAQLHVDDFAFDALDAARLGVAAQVLRVEAGIEVIGVGDAATAASPPARRWRRT